MDRSERRGLSEQPIDGGLIMAVALGVAFGTAFDRTAFGFAVGIDTGVLLFGGLTFKRGR